MNIHIVHLPVLQSFPLGILRGLMFFGSELPLSLYFAVLLLGICSLDIEALGTAQEVLI